VSLKMLIDFQKCQEITTKQHFFIRDGEDQQAAYIDENFGEFEIINPKKNSLSFLKIDTCIFDSNDISRCDCAIYDENTFCFIELKCIKPKNFNKKRREAEKQLETTIVQFQQEDILQNKKKEAFVCCNCFINETKNFEPITQRPSNNEKIVYFSEHLNTMLYYSTKKEFD